MGQVVSYVDMPAVSRQCKSLDGGWECGGNDVGRPCHPSNAKEQAPSARPPFPHAHTYMQHILPWNSLSWQHKNTHTLSWLAISSSGMSSLSWPAPVPPPPKKRVLICKATKAGPDGRGSKRPLTKWRQYELSNCHSYERQQGARGLVPIPVSPSNDL